MCCCDTTLYIFYIIGGFKQDKLEAETQPQPACIRMVCMLHARFHVYIRLICEVHGLRRLRTTAAPFSWSLCRTDSRRDPTPIYPERCTACAGKRLTQLYLRAVFATVPRARHSAPLPHLSCCCVYTALSSCATLIYSSIEPVSRTTGDHQDHQGHLETRCWQRFLPGTSPSNVRAGKSGVRLFILLYDKYCLP